MAPLNRLAKKDDPTNSSQITEKNVQCYKCQEYGHKASSCAKGPVKPLPSQVRQCYKCSGFGHEARVCPSRRPQAGGVSTSSNTFPRGNEVRKSETSGGCLVNKSPSVKEEEFTSEDEVKNGVAGSKVMLSSGKNIPFLNSVCVVFTRDSKEYASCERKNWRSNC